jgi:hypothetical protein
VAAAERAVVSGATGVRLTAAWTVSESESVNASASEIEIETGIETGIGTEIETGIEIEIETETETVGAIATGTTAVQQARGTRLPRPRQAATRSIWRRSASPPSPACSCARAFAASSAA